MFRAGRLPLRRRIQQWSDNGGDAQHWEAQPVDDGYFMIRSSRNGLVLEVADASMGDHAKVQQAVATNAPNQQWAFDTVTVPPPTIELPVVAQSNSYYQIRSRSSGKVLDVPSGSADAGSSTSSSGPRRATTATRSGSSCRCRSLWRPVPGRRSSRTEIGAGGPERASSERTARIRRGIHSWALRASPAHANAVVPTAAERQATGPSPRPIAEWLAALREGPADPVAPFRRMDLRGRWGEPLPDWAHGDPGPVGAGSV